MKNKEKFKRTYDDIHAPEALLWKVMDMNKEKNTKKFRMRNAMKYAVCTLAITAVTGLASNGICYATTGESLVTKIKVSINGGENEVVLDENGKGQITIPKEDGSEQVVQVNPKSKEELTANDFGEYTDENGNPVEPDLIVQMEGDGNISYNGDLSNSEIALDYYEMDGVTGVSIDVVDKVE